MDGRDSNFSCGLSDEEDEEEERRKSPTAEILKIPHEFDYKSVDLVKCNSCLEVQTPQKFCQNCSAKFGEYFCRKCALFDNNVSKRYFHCNGCGTCKTGGRENFYHCDVCKTCVTMGRREDHYHKIEVEEICPVCDQAMDQSFS